MAKVITIMTAAVGVLLTSLAQRPPAEVLTLDAAGEPLRSAFNEAAGATRLIALVAPT